MATGARGQPRRTWPVVLVAVTFAVDVAAVIAGYDLARALLDLFFPSSVAAFGGVRISPIVFATIAIWPVVFAFFGLYKPQRLMRFSRAELLRGCAAAVVSTLLIVLVSFEAHAEPRRELIPALLV